MYFNLWFLLHFGGQEELLSLDVKLVVSQTLHQFFFLGGGGGGATSIIIGDNLKGY